MKYFVNCILMGISVVISAQGQQEYAIATIAFYNVENLFDPIDNSKTFDEEYTPKGKYHWTQSQYENKIEHTARVLSKIGTPLVSSPPVLIGVAEIENKSVLQDLIQSSALVSYQYSSIHFESPDRRGIDVGLLYQKNRFRPLHTSTHTLYLYDDEVPTKRIYTRDQLLVSGWLDGELLYLLVNHWPSRRGGKQKSAPKRIQAAALQRQLLDSIRQQDPYAKLIVMGDFNDDPHDTSIREVLEAKADTARISQTQLYNPMAQMAQLGFGSLAWGDRWNLFDQIMISKSLVHTNFQTYTYYKAGIYNPKYLTQDFGKYKGYPYRSFSNLHYTGGYSDHFPVYLYLIKSVP